MEQETLLVLTNKQFDQIINKLDAIEQLLQGSQGKPGTTGYLEQYEMEKATGLSRGTLLRMRKEGVLRATKLGGKKLFYNSEDLQKLLRKENG